MGPQNSGRNRQVIAIRRWSLDDQVCLESYLAFTLFYTTLFANKTDNSSSVKFTNSKSSKG